MHQKKWVGILFIALNFFIAAQAQSTEVVINKVAGVKEQLAVDILTLALKKTDPQAIVRQHSEELPQSRLVDEIKLGNIDLMWAGVDPTLESELKPVRIPMFKGLLGHRIFIIKKGNQARFDNIKTLQDLKQLKAGQGTQWGDTQILKGANIPVVTTLKYPNLFLMLEGERFDYFPRAIHEPWSEVEERPELNLTVEKNIMLVYPFAMYFFVNKDNQALHDKLYKGFEMAIADGSFNELFFNNQLIKDALNKTNIKNR
ncbi:MAG: ABC-type amino acid transport substrate-binding protein, partial [Psychromonas sp.]|uniref:substrate-binding periplasmic protein n=1 Tax=Psychromonas sp. TaxID=1884585 RepID=UPI0039E35933